MKTLTLDYSKWRAGGDQKKTKIGKGDTFLRNKQGYMCCLGQFSLQLDPSLRKKDIMGHACPDSLGKEIPSLTKPDPLGDGTIFNNTKLTSKAMYFNDGEDIT